MKSLITLLLVIGIAVTASAAPRKNGDTSWRRGRQGDGSCLKTTAVTEAASEQEMKDLSFMREEEKLARDVYQALYALWNVPIFTNIAASEQRHTSAIAGLLTRYEITDPVVDDSPGVFVNPQLAELYTQLLQDGAKSLDEALVIGATIEDLDIADLEEAIANTDKPDLKQVYSNLMAGSENHLRAFAAQLTARGETYVPQHISQERFDAIIATDRGRGGNRGAGGNGRGRRAGRGAR